MDLPSLLYGANCRPFIEAKEHELLGAANRELNTIVGPHFGPLPGPGETTWRATFSPAQLAVVESTKEHTEFLGGQTDLWGRGVFVGWSNSDISDNNFRLRVTAQGSSFARLRDYYLDWIAIKLFYGP